MLSFDVPLALNSRNYCGKTNNFNGYYQLIRIETQSRIFPYASSRLSFQWIDWIRFCVRSLVTHMYHKLFSINKKWWQSQTADIDRRVALNNTPIDFADNSVSRLNWFSKWHPAERFHPTGLLSIAFEGIRGYWQTMAREKALLECGAVYVCIISL